jgi:hypothetical protein
VIQALRHHRRPILASGSPALASLALAPWLGGPPRPGRVLGVTTEVAWCALDDQVVLLSSPDGVRFPNAILATGWTQLEPDDEVVIGSDRLASGATRWQVVRWWDPRPTPIAARRTDVLARASDMEAGLPPTTCLPLGIALTSGEHAAILDQTRAMLGAGRGLTPEGDDRLIGAFAAFRHVSSSLGRADRGRRLDEMADEILGMASRMTSSLSATLLRHSLAGDVPGPVADLLRSLTGRGRPSDAMDRCLAVGGSSGRALADGVLCGTRAACEVSW